MLKLCGQKNRRDGPVLHYYCKGEREKLMFHDSYPENMSDHYIYESNRAGGSL